MDDASGATSNPYKYRASAQQEFTSQSQSSFQGQAAASNCREQTWQLQQELALNRAQEGAQQASTADTRESHQDAICPLPVEREQQLTWQPFNTSQSTPEIGQNVVNSFQLPHASTNVGELESRTQGQQLHLRTIPAQPWLYSIAQGSHQLVPPGASGAQQEIATSSTYVPNAHVVGSSSGSVRQRSTSYSSNTLLTKRSSDAGEGADADAIETKRSRSSRKVVIVWDLDETLILFNSFLNGTYVQAHGLQKKAEIEALGNLWSDAILDFSDNFLFFSEMEERDQCTLSDLHIWDDGADLTTYDFANDGLVGEQDSKASWRKLAYRFRHMQTIYDKGLLALEQADRDLDIIKLYSQTDTATNGWLSSARRLVKGCQDGELASLLNRQGNWCVTEVTNIVVTTGQLIPTLGKLLLFQLADCFHHQDILSARNDGKLHCFERIRARYGEDSAYCVIGDSREEKEAARNLGWPFVEVCLKKSEKNSAEGQPMTSMQLDRIACALTSAQPVLD